MRSFSWCRSFSFVSVWCVALAVLGTSFFQATPVHATEFKPFLTAKIAGPGAIINLAEKISGVADPTGTQGIKEILAPYKNLPGINANGVIGLALQINENSPFGMDIVLALPISNWDNFNVPDMEETLGMLKAMMQKEGNRYMLSSPFGDFIAYQKSGYLVVATMDAAGVAQAADPRTMFASLDKFTLGVTFDLENISLEDVERMSGQLAMIFAMQGAEFDPEEVLEHLSDSGIFDEYSSVTYGLTMDERTLTVSGSMQIVPKKGSETAEKFQQVKNAKTMFGGFLQDTARTVFSWSHLDYLTDREIAETATALQLIGSSFAEGFRESAEEDDHGELFARLTEIIVEWLQEYGESDIQNRLVDMAMSLDSDGVFLYAQAVERPELVTKIGNDLYNALPELFGEEEGKALQALISSKMKQNYETVEGFALSSLSNAFVELPPGVVVPRVLRDLPVSLLWGTKKGEAVAVAVGFDFARTERALKTALERTKTPTQPKQTGVFALKPFGEFVVKQVLPLVEKSGMATRDDIEEAKEVFAILASAESSAKMVWTTEFPGTAQLQKIQIDGRCLQAFAKMMAKQAELTAKRFTREFQRQ